MSMKRKKKVATGYAATWTATPGPIPATVTATITSDGCCTMPPGGVYIGGTNPVPAKPPEHPETLYRHRCDPPDGRPDYFLEREWKRMDHIGHTEWRDMATDQHKRRSDDKETIGVYKLVGLIHLDTNIREEVV